MFIICHFVVTRQVGWRSAIEIFYKNVSEAFKPETEALKPEAETQAFLSEAEARAKSWTIISR